MDQNKTEVQKTALAILQTSNSIASPEQLAAVISDPRIPKYHQLNEEERIRWLAEQINALYYMTHSSFNPNEVDLFIELSLINQTIMEDEEIRSLTLIEMEVAFKKGIMKEYGEYFGITPVSLVGFLKGFKKSPKRQRAITILLEKERQRIEEEKKRENRMLYEPRVKNLIIPFWKSKRGSHKITEEESSAHRKKINEQREEIMREYEITKK